MKEDFIEILFGFFDAREKVGYNGIEQGDIVDGEFGEIDVF